MLPMLIVPSELNVIRSIDSLISVSPTVIDDNSPPDAFKLSIFFALILPMLIAPPPLNVIESKDSLVSVFPIEIDENSLPDALIFSIFFALIVPTFISPPSVVIDKEEILLMLVVVPKSPSVIFPFLDAIRAIEVIFWRSGSPEVPGVPREISPSLNVFNETVLRPWVPVILVAAPIIMSPSLSFPISILWVSSGSRFKVGMVIVSLPVFLNRNWPASFIVKEVRSTEVPVLLVHSK